MKTARQVKDLIRNLSKKTGVDSQILIRQYMMDHLLERISQTRYRDHFILKGGMLISALVGVTLRSTLDMDATIQGFPFRSAFVETSKYRGSTIMHHEIDNAFEAIKESPDLERHWQNYQRRYNYAGEIAYTDVCSSIEKLIRLLKVIA